MTSVRERWRRAAAVVKDQRSIFLTMLPIWPRKELRNPNMMVAIIRATSHNERFVDYKNVGRVFAWARTSPSLIGPLMWAVARRVNRTRSWHVALKSLLLVHGLLLISSGLPGSSVINGKLPFDLSDFRDRSSSNSCAFSAFVRAYFHFLDNRAILLSATDEEEEEDDGCDVNRVEELQKLLDLLMQVRPYADGMGVGLILEAMDCTVIEIFHVYSAICSGIASFLVCILGSGSNPKSKMKGMKAICVLRRAREQSAQLRSYFEVCKSLGVLNATEFPPVERIPDEDIKDLEKLLNGEIPEDEEPRMEEKQERTAKDPPSKKTVVTKDWVVFEDESRSNEGSLNNPFIDCSASERQWASMVHCSGNSPWNGNLIELE